jgi:hypothetical protein
VGHCRLRRIVGVGHARPFMCICPVGDRPGSLRFGKYGTYPATENYSKVTELRYDGTFSLPHRITDVEIRAGIEEIAGRTLLNAAESAHFDVLLNVDRGLEYEQNLAGRRIAAVIFRTKSIALQELLPHVPACLAVLASIKPGEIAKVPQTRTSR